MTDASGGQSGQVYAERTERTELLQLADEYGVATSYRDWHGEQVSVATETLVAVLGAFDVDASTPQATREALAQARVQPWRRLLPPTVVTHPGGTRFPVHAPQGEPVAVWVELEDGDVRDGLQPLDDPREQANVDGRSVVELRYEVPPDLPLGWHQLWVRCGTEQASVYLAVTPDHLDGPLTDGKRPWGFMTQLYSVRTRRSWGIGDLGDLAELARWSGGELGAGMLLVNPLHAAQPQPPLEPSPYLPASRRYINPLYLRVEDAPEYELLPAEQRRRADDLGAPLRAPGGVASVGDDEAETAEAAGLAGLADSTGIAGPAWLLDRDACWWAKRAALELIFRVPRDSGRESAYAAFRAREGRALVDFATWCALAEEYGPSWRQWPRGLREPHSDAVAAERSRLAERVDFHAWLQWLLDEQLDRAQQAAQAAGMPVGIVHDLAVGASPDGADAWILQDVLAQGVTVGAPPDEFNQQGQDWAQPPWRPDRLAAAGYRPYRDMLRYCLRHGGGLRIDHILGMFRLWWVPQGADASAGTYVTLNHHDLVGILVLEAYRAGAVVVGEDLGTFEPWVRDYLAGRGVLGTSLLWFEQAADGSPLPPQHWRELSLATVRTHDMPPIASHLAGRHIDLRERLGMLERSVEQERITQAETIAAWLELLRTEGLLGPEPEEWEIVEALHAVLAATPCRMLGVDLADAVGERHSQNLPGTVDIYPNWRVPLADDSGRPLLLEDVRADPRPARLARIAAGNALPS